MLRSFFLRNVRPNTPAVISFFCWWNVVYLQVQYIRRLIPAMPCNTIPYHTTPNHTRSTPSLTLISHHTRRLVLPALSVSVCLFVGLPACLSVFRCLSDSLRVCVSPSLSLSVSLSIYVSVCTCVYFVSCVPGLFTQRATSDPPRSCTPCSMFTGD